MLQCLEPVHLDERGINHAIAGAVTAGAVIAWLTAITQLLEIINNILAGLNPGGAAGASFGLPMSAATTGIYSA